MHLTETQINDFADGTLAGAARAQAEDHVLACAQCRAQVQQIQLVLQRLSTLPREIEPEHDLRAAIWAQADRKTLWSWRYPLAAAAILLIAVSSLVTTFVLRRSQPDSVRISVAEAESGARVDLVRIEQTYASEVETLQDTLEQNREQFAPETVRILEDNLRIIDTAISEARAALARDPQSAVLGELLKSAYRRKLDLLRQAARSSAAT